MKTRSLFVTAEFEQQVFNGFERVHAMKARQTAGGPDEFFAAIFQNESGLAVFFLEAAGHKTHHAGGPWSRDDDERLRVIERGFGLFHNGFHHLLASVIQFFEFCGFFQCGIAFGKQGLQRPIGRFNAARGVQPRADLETDGVRGKFTSPCSGIF